MGADHTGSVFVALKEVRVFRGCKPLTTLVCMGAGGYAVVAMGADAMTMGADANVTLFDLTVMHLCASAWSDRATDTLGVRWSSLSRWPDCSLRRECRSCGADSRNF